MEFQHTTTTTTTTTIIIISGKPHDGASPYPRFHSNSIAIVLANVENNENLFNSAGPRLSWTSQGLLQWRAKSIMTDFSGLV